MHSKQSKLINFFSIATTCAIILFAQTVNAQAYRRYNDAAMTSAPRQGASAENSQTRFAYNGHEAAPYAYGYSFNLPNDGNWRYIEPRCYNSASGNTCVDGHWIRKQAGRCEEVTSHSVRTGNYVRIVRAGAVSTCRN